MQSLRPYIASDGTKYHIPPEKEAEFMADFGDDAKPARRFRTTDGTSYTIPADMMDSFRADFPDATPVRRFSFADGSSRDFTPQELDMFVSGEFGGERYAEDRRRIAASFGDATSAIVKKRARGESISRRDVAAAGLPEMSSASRNALGDILTADYRVVNKPKTSGLLTLGGIPIEEAASAAALEDAKAREEDAALAREEVLDNRDVPGYAKPFRYLGDLMTSFGGGLVGGFGKIVEGVGTATEIRGNMAGANPEDTGAAAVTRAGRAIQEWAHNKLDTNLTGLEGDGIGTKALEIGKGVASVSGEFAPTAIPYVGKAYGAGLIGSGALLRGRQVYDDAIKSGMTEAQAISLAMGAGVIDAFSNMLLMGKFKGIWKGAKKTATDAVKQRVVKKLFADSLKTGGIMAGQGAANELIDEIAKGEDVSAKKIGMAAASKGLEGMVFHIANYGAHRFAHVVDWRTPANSVSESYRKALQDPAVRALVYTNSSPETLNAILEARAAGKDVPQELLVEFGIPKEAIPTAADCNSFADTMLKDLKTLRAKTDKAEGETPSVRLDEYQTKVLDDVIAEFGGEGEVAKDIRARVISKLEDPRTMDDPDAREKAVMAAFEEYNAEHQKEFDAEEHRRKSMAGMEERARRKAEMAEYEKQEAERKAREEAEQHKPKIEVGKAQGETPSAPAAEGRQRYPEYYEWLAKTGKKDSDKNWRKFVAENELDPALAGKRSEPPAEKPTVKPDGKGKMAPVEPKSAVEEVKKPEIAAEPPQKPVETRPAAKTGKDTSASAKPVEAPSRAPDTKPVPDGKGKMVPVADKQGNPIDAKGKLKLEPVEKVSDMTDDDFTKPTRNVRLPKVPDNVDAAIGANGKPIVIKKNIFEKNAAHHPELDAATSRSILERALYNPNLVGQTQPVSRPNYRVAIQTGDKSAVTVLEIAQTKDNVEIIGWRNINERSLEQMKKQAAKEGGQLLVLHPSEEGQSVGFSDRHRGSSVGSIAKTAETGNEAKPAVKPDGKGKLVKPKTPAKPKAAAPAANEAGGTAYTPSKELVEAKSRIEAMPETNARQKNAKKKAQKDWLLSSIDDAIKSHKRKVDVEKFGDDYEKMSRSRDTTYDGKKLADIRAWIKKAGETLRKGGMITFDVPDDGTFKVYNNPEALALFKHRVQRRLSPTSLKEGTIAKAEKPLAEDVKDLGIGEKVDPDKPSSRLESRAPDGDPLGEPAPASAPKSEKAKFQKIEPITPEQEITERLDLQRLDPKRRSDPKVLAWAKKNGRNVTNGMVTPDAVRAYDEAMTEATAKKARRWFPDMKIVTHKFGETIKRGQHVIEQRVEEATTHATEALASIVDGKPYGVLHNDKYGEIQYPLGRFRNVKPSGKVEGGMGFLHIVEERMRKDGATLEEAIETAIRVGRAAEIGEETASIKNTRWLEYDGTRAIIALTENGKPIITGYEISADKPSVAYPSAESRPSSPLERKATIIAALKKKIAQHAAEVNGGTEKSYLRDTSGNVLGWFDPRSKEVHLLPGANPETVAHEIMWHGTRQYMTDLAAKGDARAQKFLDMMHDVEQHAPQAIKDLVNRLYARGGRPVSRDTLLNEYGAWFTMKKGGEALEKALATDAGRNWFARGLHTVKEMFKDFLTRHGRNRVDLSAIDGMTRDEFVDFLAKEFASGKTLGSIKGPQPPTVSTKETWLGKYKRRNYDQNAAVRDLERDIEKKTGAKISADDSVEAANALKYGLKEAANIDTQGKMREFRKVLGEAGIHYEDFEYYAALKAAAGRDAKIDARNIAKLTAELRAAGASEEDIATAVANYKSTNGSHIDPREARSLLAEIENGPDAAKFKKAYDAIRPIIDETLDIQVKAGLVDAAEAAQWRAEEPNYIPFKNEYDVETGEWQGRGMSRNFSKPEHHMAKGRQSAAGDILAHIFMDYQAAKLRAIENGVRQKLAKLVQAHPELGKVKIIDRDAVRNAEKDSPNVVVFKDGGRSYKITLEGTRGEAVANAFTQRNQLKMEWADKKFMGVSVRGFARWSAGMATRYSPTFSVRNTTKDNIELANIVYSERGPIEGTKFMSHYVASRAQMAATLVKYITTGKIDTANAHGKILDRYIKAGGLIAGGTRAEAFDSIKKSLTPEAIAKEMRRGNSKTRAVAKHVLNSIGYLNEYAEMATRVGIFDAEIKMGKSDAEAALFSRRATVDFNRHGDFTPATNMFRLFSNSTLGATARAAAALTKSKYGMAAAGALFVNGVARVLIDHFVNAEEDERRRKTGAATGRDISEYERRTSLFYFRNGDKLYKVAEHESPFSLISYAGDCIGRWICGELDGKDVAKNLGVEAAEIAYTFLPMGSINLTSQNGGLTDDAKAALISGVLPTFLQPVAETVANIDYAGRSVYNTPWPGDKTPRAEQGRDATPDWAKKAAMGLNEATRSEGSRAGYIDVPPEAIQKLAEGYGKNAMRDVLMAYEVGNAIIKGEVSRLDPRNKPVKRDFVRPLDGNDSRFAAARKKFEANLDYFKEMSGDMTDAERSDYLAKFPHIRGDRGRNILKAIARLRKLERGFGIRNGKFVPHEWPQEKLDEFKANRRKLQAEFLEMMGE